MYFKSDRRWIVSIIIFYSIQTTLSAKLDYQLKDTCNDEKQLSHEELKWLYGQGVINKIIIYIYICDNS